MDNCEAIEILRKKIVPCVKHSALEEAVNMAISALEKQEGKKPIDRRCPNCGARMDGGVDK